MDIVKVVINLKEGILHLEGPQEFVEKYLNLYRPDASKWKSVISQEGEVKTKEEATAKRTRTRTARTKVGPSCGERIRGLIAEDYFKDLRTSTEVMNYLKDQKGITYNIELVTATLSNIIKSGKLRRIKEGKIYKYCNV